MKIQGIKKLCVLYFNGNFVTSLDKQSSSLHSCMSGQPPLLCRIFSLSLCLKLIREMDNIFLLALNSDSRITTRNNVKWNQQQNWQRFLLLIFYQIFPVNVKQQVCEFRRLTVKDADRDTQFQHTDTHTYIFSKHSFNVRSKLS